MENSERKVNAALVSPELTFTTSRSSGPGGQNVNKVNSKVTVTFDVQNSQILSPEEKEVILTKLRSRITTEGVLMVAAQEKRSQLQNKEVVLLKLDKLLQKAFEVKKPRKPTRPGKAAKEKRIKQKRQQSEKKQWRQKPL
jgi:ribosome-associated protein